MRHQADRLAGQKRLAEFLHRKYCPYEHVEQCGWDYEEDLRDTWPDPWTGSAHLRWLKQARTVRDFIEAL